jgi:hypothetical protein
MIGTHTQSTWMQLPEFAVGRSFLSMSMSMNFVAALALSLSVSGVGGADFGKDVQPLLKEYCLNCHSTKKQKGDLDLERFTSLDLVKRDPGVWEHSLEQIHNNEMPPKDKPRPTPEQMKLLTSWMQGTLDQIALASAGDPGPVVLRRLSNMEYTYTVRDLTGVASLDPAQEFPVDGAAGEGFTNVGAALVMSPSLLTKYLDAAKDIASHAVLTPHGFHFSASTSSRDWTDETLAKIREFYARFTESGNGIAVEQQGIKLDVNGGGVLSLEKYIAATRKSDGAAQLNAKYLRTLREALEGSQPSLILDIVRQQWRAGAPASAIAATITQWQQALWRFASIGHIGKLNGPKSWQIPVLPLTSSEELRVKLPEGRPTTIYLATHNIGEASAIWENARLVTAGKPDRPIAITGQDLQLPADIDKDTEFVINVRLHPDSKGAVQARILTTKPTSSALVASKVIFNKPKTKGTWSDGEKPISFDAPILVGDDSEARKHITAQIAEFRALFPAALCYTKIVPVDEVVTLTLFYREDEPLKRLMLDEAQIAEIDRLWEELRFVSESPLKQVDVFEQLWQFATQDADPSAFEPMREPIQQGAVDFKKQVIEIEPKHVQAMLDFATQAWRRPLTTAEQNELRALYQKLRKQEMPHAAAVRMLLTRVFVAPAFLYRGEKAAPGLNAAPVNDWELATRLSYFLWSSSPDEELRAVAAAGKLLDQIVPQARRMLKDAKIRRLATEFGCQWLHVRDVETLDEKSERHFPTFAALRGDMQEEAVRFFMDLFQADRSVLSLLDADYSFMNGSLAQHYGLDLKNKDWQRVDDLRTKGRGGILGFASTLAKQSGASRTSPILRGNWLSEVVLGDKLPRPPKGVPILPEEAPQGLTERQLIERHSSDAKCAGCHQRIDPFGFALEGFDAIGRARNADTHAILPDGTRFEGLDGLRSYLMTIRRDDFLRQFCRKLLGYALGRAVQLSDKPLIETMIAQLKANDHRVTTAIELIIQSPQFREVRGRDFITSN